MAFRMSSTFNSAWISVYTFHGSVGACESLPAVCGKPLALAISSAFLFSSGSVMPLRVSMAVRSSVCVRSAKPSPRYGCGAMVMALFSLAKSIMVWDVHGFGGSSVVPRMIISPSSAVISAPGIMRMSGYGLASCASAL